MKENYQIRSLPRMFEQVAHQIANYITSEELTKGTKIPTERSLSELLEVSRSSVREGLRVLELLRFLDSRQGEGTFVSEPPPFLIPHLVLKQPLESDQLKHYYEIGVQIAETIVIEVMKFRERPSHDFQATSDSGWSAFHQWISFLGGHLENPYFISLWSDIYTLLLAHDYFGQISFILDFHSLQTAYDSNSKETVQEIFVKIKKI